MAIIQVPAKSIIGKPKLNIANDNNFESVGYTDTNRSYSKYVKLWGRELNIIDTSLLASSEGKVMWSPPFSKDFQPNYLGTDTGGSDLKFYRYKEGAELVDNFKLFIPSGVSSKFNYHDFVIKITVPKPDKNVDYSKYKFRYEDDVTSNRPVPNWNNVVFDSARLKDFTDGDFTKEIENQYIFDETTSESEILSTFVNSDFTQTLTYNTQDVFVKLRITNDNLEFYCIATAIIGTPATKNVDGSIDMIYTRTLSFYYVDMETTTNDKINENAKYSLPDNELLAEQTKYNGTSIYDQISNSIVSEYEKGKFSVDLSCLYMKYVDSNGNVVYNGTDGKTISVGDIIQPYYYNSENGDLPVATYEDGSAMCFKVYKSEIATEDSKYITNSVSAIEIQKPVPYTINITSNRDDISKLVQLNGVAIEGSVVAYMGDTIFIPASNVGNWTNVSINGVEYPLETNKVGIGFTGYTFEITQDMSIYFYKYTPSIN